MKKHILLTLSLAAAVAASGVAGAMPNNAAHGNTTISPSAAPGEPITGKVVQTMNSGGYSYVLLEKKDGKKVWVAVTETPGIKVGEKMSFKPGMEMANFESKTLKRKFDSIIFSDGVATAQGATAKGAGKSDMGNSPGSKGAATAKEKISVAKATGANAYTVEGIFTNSAKLDKKPVVVKGKVVKVSNGIMGKNWVHIQDGSGSQEKGTHNLVCTTKDKAEVGDVVTVSGTLTKDKDFGAGYKYNAIIEDAKIKK